MTSLEYLLVTGVFVAGFLALSLLLVDAMAASTGLKSVVLALPVG